MGNHARHIAREKTDIIFASLSGYGRQGPWSEYPANGATTEPMSGFASVHGYEDDEAANTAGLIPDPITGYYFASSILSAIHHRNKTGQGQRIDEAMMEAVAVQMGDGMLHCDATGEVQDLAAIGIHDMPHTTFSKTATANGSPLLSTRMTPG